MKGYENCILAAVVLACPERPLESTVMRETLVLITGPPNCAILFPIPLVPPEQHCALSR